MRNLGPEIWVTLGLVLDIHILYGISTFDSHSESFELELNGIPRLVAPLVRRSSFVENSSEFLEI